MAYAMLGIQYCRYLLDIGTLSHDDQNMHVFDDVMRLLFMKSIPPSWFLHAQRKMRIYYFNTEGNAQLLLM